MTNKKPTLHGLPRFSEGVFVRPELFANREAELRTALRALLQDQVNLLVTGPRKVGKTSFLHKLMAEVEIAAPAERRLLVFFDMLILRERTLQSFTSEIVVSICAKIASVLYQVTYSQLLDSINHPASITELRDPGAATLQRIFRLARSKSHDFKTSSGREVGASLVATAKVTELREIQAHVDELTGHEFIMFVEELSSLIRTKGIGPITVLCDEANNLPDDLTAEVLHRYFEIFRSRQVQFVFVVASQATALVPDLRTAFECHVEMGPFSGPKSVLELLKLVLNAYARDGGSSIPFEDDCAPLLFDIAKGHPWKVQALCRMAYETAIEEKARRVTPDMVTRSSVRFVQHFAGWGD